MTIKKLLTLQILLIVSKREIPGRHKHKERNHNKSCHREHTIKELLFDTHKYIYTLMDTDKYLPAQ